jgi:hypothetical protein
MMTRMDGITARSGSIGSRINRLPLVLLLALGLLASLMHCAGCEMSFALADNPAVLTDLDHGTAPDTPEQQLLCHSGHCLSHVTVQVVAAAMTPADLVLRAPDFGRQQSPDTFAGLPLFKPPRA